MAHVWLVTSGEYSDYSVDCAFTTEALAVEYAARLNGITVAQQLEAQRIEDLPHSEYHKALAAVPVAVRRAAQDGVRVERFDLYDVVPIVAAREP